MMQENNASGVRDGFEIDIQKLLLNYLFHWWVLLLCALVAAAGCYFVTSRYITPTYRASVSIYVNNSRYSNPQAESVSSSDLNDAARVVATYVNIIKSNTVLEKVSEAIDGRLSAAQIREMMSASQKDKTEMFDIIITGTDPELIALTANTVAEVAPAQIENFVEGSSTKIIDYAKVPTVPYSPDVKKITISGALAGLGIALLILTLRFVMDVRIKIADDLENQFVYPVLGQIPLFSQVDETGKYRSHYYKNHYYKNNYSYESETPGSELPEDLQDFDVDAVQLLSKVDALTGDPSRNASRK